MSVLTKQTWLKDCPISRKKDTNSSSNNNNLPSTFSNLIIVTLKCMNSLNIRNPKPIITQKQQKPFTLLVLFLSPVTSSNHSIDKPTVKDSLLSLLHRVYTPAVTRKSTLNLHEQPQPVYTAPCKRPTSLSPSGSPLSPTIKYLLLLSMLLCAAIDAKHTLTHISNLTAQGK